MEIQLTSRDRRELLRTAAVYEMEADRTGREALRAFALEMRRFAWSACSPAAPGMAAGHAAQ